MVILQTRARNETNGGTMLSAENDTDHFRCHGADEEATTIKVASSKAMRKFVKLKRPPTKPSAYRQGMWKEAMASIDSMSTHHPSPNPS